MADGHNKRAANARASERQLLTDLVMSRIDIIENEKTNSVTTRDKKPPEWLWRPNSTLRR